MGTSHQPGSREDAINPISASSSRKAIVSKKGGAKPLRSVNSDNDTVICADSSAWDLEARIALRAHQLYEERGAVTGKIKPTGLKPNARYWLQDEETDVFNTKDFMNTFLLRIRGNEVCEDGFLIEQGENEKAFLRHHPGSKRRSLPLDPEKNFPSKISEMTSGQTKNPDFSIWGVMVHI